MKKSRKTGWDLENIEFHPENVIIQDKATCMWCGNNDDRDHTKCEAEFIARTKGISATVAPGSLPPDDNRYSHDQLLAALYWIHDAMDRGLINFCVIGPTADAIINNKALYGDGVYIAVRKNEWDGGGRRIVDAFALSTKEEETEHGPVLEYDHYGTPIVLHILNDSVTLSSPNNVIYHAEYFKYPNTYDQFLEEFPYLK